MKNLITLTFALLLFFVACKDDEGDSFYEYHAHIFMPTDADKHMGEALPIDIEFESHTGENVEHINVRIYNAATLADAYNAPADAYIGSTEDHFVYQDTVQLSPANGFGVGDWILEAKVWGEDAGQEEVTETVEFRIIN